MISLWHDVENAIVETQVGGEVRLLIVGGRPPLPRTHRDQGDLVARGSRGREPRRERLDRQTHLGRRLLVQPSIVCRLGAPAEHVGVEDVPLRPRSHTGACLRPGFDKTLGSKDAHRLAQHGPADGEIRREVVLGWQQVARLQAHR